MIYDHSKDSHDSMDVIRLYAMPNLNASYTADRIEATKWDGDYPECAVCGRTHGPHEVHHEPPRSKGSLLLDTPWGNFVVKPALICLCKDCHEDRHAKLLRIDWKWDSEEDEEKYLDGWFYAHGYQEHDARFFRHGRIVMRRGEYEWEVRR